MFNRYMSQKLIYRKFLNKKDSMGSPLYGEEEEIDGFSYAEDVYVRGEDSSEMYQVTVYITEKEVNTKDLLNNKIVKSAVKMRDLRGNYTHTESKTE